MGSIIIGGIIALLIIWFIMKPRKNPLFQRFPEKGVEISRWVTSGKPKDMERAVLHLVWYSSKVNRNIREAEAFCAAKSTIGQMIMMGAASVALNEQYYTHMSLNTFMVHSICHYGHQKDDPSYGLTYNYLVHFYQATESTPFLKAFIEHAQNFPQQVDGLTVGKILMNVELNLKQLIREGRIK